MKTISSLPARAAAWRSNTVGCASRWIKRPNRHLYALRQYLKDDAARRKTVANAVKGAPAEIREQFMAAAENTLSIFAKAAIWLWTNLLPPIFRKSSRKKCRANFYEMLYGVMNAALEDTISTYNLPAWPQDEKRNRFLLHAMDAYTGLTEYPAPMLLQLESFTEVRSSGLQMTRSPGAFLVYLGSVLLVLGTVFMFYIREKRAWLLFSDGRIRFAMSSSRNERDLQKEFPQHTRQLQQLAKD